MLGKTWLTALIFLALLFVLAPIASYTYRLSVLESFPEKAHSENLSELEVEKIWQLAEPTLKISEVHNITPYWVYSWLLSAFSEEITNNKKYTAASNQSPFVL